MQITADEGSFERAIDGLEDFFSGIDRDLKQAGGVAAAEMIRATLGGIGPNDQPFEKYSEAYQQVLDSVGGKPQGVVNLRGVFSKDAGQSNPKFRSNERRRLSGAGRQAYIEVNAGGKKFTARTPITRVARGLTDPQSEMSLDLLTVASDGHSFTIGYNPRSQDYMLAHNDGSGRAPKREWFTLNRSSVIAAIRDSLERSLTLRVDRFNGPSSAPLIASDSELSDIFGIDII